VTLSLRHLLQRFSLREGTDQPGTVSRISDGIELSSEHTWLLICSAVLASIGLDISSAAVIIGAMLISPLMGPILGTGMAIGISDRQMLQRSLRELGLATGLSLVASAFYFLISPLGEATPELIARTRPTLLDVGVALFGGVAGIVAASRKQQSMALPGVAIATALMPPLCTAGFGLATGSPAFFLGAFYLFLINAVFIALATFLAVRLLRFQRHEFLDAADRRRELRLIAAITILSILPSIYFLYDAARNLRERGRIDSFISREIEGPGREAPQWQVERHDEGRVLKVYLAGSPLEPERLDSIRTTLPSYGLGKLRLDVVQSDISARDLARFEGQVQREVLMTLQSALASRDSTAAAAAAAAAASRARRDSIPVAAVAREMAGTFPEIAAVAWVPRPDLLAADSLRPPPAFMVSFGPGVRTPERARILERARAFVRLRTGTDTLTVVER
jgi:uncharacterized hydrophobic protein (TIGR00271 family)